ncbi:hypothetical protein EDB84DRAFT_1600412 [Lactarius hengduanensis]|nr:hypothetical protein EDB84DRAFT_1600412 [Lactarius hengduanensis]
MVHAPLHALGHQLVCLQLADPAPPQRIARDPLRGRLWLRRTYEDGTRRDALLGFQHVLVLRDVRQRAAPALGTLPAAAWANVARCAAARGTDAQRGGSSIRHARRGVRKASRTRRHLARPRAPALLWPAWSRPLAWWDDRLRAGDVVEWRSVRIGAAQFGAFAVMGDLDHTAVLVEGTVPRFAVADGDGVRPADVGVLMVVEQTVGRASRLQDGEVWIYRPVGVVEYLGSTLSVEIPSELETLAL